MVIVRLLAKGLFGRLLSYAVFAIGFWLLYRGVAGPNIPLGILGGALVLLGMYIMVGGKGSAFQAQLGELENQEEINQLDSLDGSNQGGKLSP